MLGCADVGPRLIACEHRAKCAGEIRLRLRMARPAAVADADRTPYVAEVVHFERDLVRHARIIWLPFVVAGRRLTGMREIHRVSVGAERL